MRRAIAALLVLCLLTGTLALAQGGAGKASGEKAGAKKGEKAGKSDRKTQTPLQKLLKELKTLVAREKSKPEHDEELLDEIESLVELFARQKEEPVSLDDLSEKDRKRLEDEVRKKMQEERGAAAQGRGAGGREDWMARRYREAVDKSLEGVRMSDDQREKCEEILSDFVKEFAPALQRGDFKMANDLKKDAENRLKKVVGAKKAKDIMNNVNRQLPNRRGWGG
jgi:hypothetical protein